MTAPACAYRNSLDGDAVVLRCRTHDHPFPCPQDPDAPQQKTTRGPREHIVRDAPPWRALGPHVPPITECGRPADGRPLVTRDEIQERIAAARAELLADVDGEPDPVTQRKIGIKASEQALGAVCKICTQRAGNNPPWTHDPGALIARETDDWPFGGPAGWSPEHRRIVTELQALADLAAAHPDEFAAALTARTMAMQAAVELAERRAERRRAALAEWRP